MFLFMILFVIAVVATIVFLARYFGPSAPPASPGVVAPESAKDILKRRYAAGEIDRGEYLQKFGDL